MVAVVGCAANGLSVNNLHFYGKKRVENGTPMPCALAVSRTLECRHGRTLMATVSAHALRTWCSELPGT